MLKLIQGYELYGVLQNSTAPDEVRVKGKTMGINKKLALSVAASAAIVESNKKRDRNVKSKNRKRSNRAKR